MKKILMKIIESSNKALKGGDTIKAMVSVESTARITIVKGRRGKPGNPADTRPPRNSKPPLWFQLWSDNVFVPFQKRIDNEINEFKQEVRETFKRNAIEFEEFKREINVKFDKLKKINNLK
jgi:hypothetical protein